MSELDFSFFSDEDFKSAFYKLMTLVADLQERLSTSQSANVELAGQLQLVQQELRLLRAKPFVGKNEHVSTDQLLLFSEVALLDPPVGADREKDWHGPRSVDSWLGKNTPGGKMSKGERE